MISTATEALKEGDLNAALAALQNQVRADPGDAKLRIFLFQLLCVRGDWKRAINQLKLCAELDALAIPMAQTYREGIICEVFREKVFAGEKDPLIFGEPEEWVALMIEANRAMGSGQAARAAELRNKAFDQVPDASGTINGQAFDWIADADMRLGPLLEIIINGKYYWMPFANIAKLSVEEPQDLRDAVWTAAQLTLGNGGEFVALIPTRYAGTAATGDNAAMLARATTWTDAGDETFLGTGQRLLTTGDQDVAIMDLRELVMDAANG
ncbi:MAG: type VI secretion system accessory protein TagJ [Sulfitobacter sp.]